MIFGEVPTVLAQGSILAHSIEAAKRPYDGQSRYRVQKGTVLTADHLGLGVQTYDPAAYYNLVREAPATYSQQGQALDRVLEAIGE